ncbi:hypothetical protein ACVW1C_008481 [Bradyrhizobium sp. USDA 4011]
MPRKQDEDENPNQAHPPSHPVHHVHHDNHA